MNGDIGYAEWHIKVESATQHQHHHCNRCKTTEYSASNAPTMIHSGQKRLRNVFFYKKKIACINLPVKLVFSHAVFF